MIFLILTLIWALALLPPLLRARKEGNPVNSVGKFRRHLRVLEQTSDLGDASSMPQSWAIEAQRRRVRRRRQQVARALLAAMATTLILGLIPNLRPLLAVHVLLDIAFVFYVYSLAKIRNERRRTPVVYYEEEHVELPAQHRHVL